MEDLLASNNRLLDQLKTNNVQFLAEVQGLKDELAELRADRATCQDLRIKLDSLQKANEAKDTELQRMSAIRDKDAATIQELGYKLREANHASRDAEIKLRKIYGISSGITPRRNDVGLNPCIVHTYPYDIPL